jgi:hypothetical protein
MAEEMAAMAGRLSDPRPELEMTPA